ncbi:MAG: hypothetical protein NVS1B2_10000 [Vulcanimicrobiaceae bacterium]
MLAVLTRFFVTGTDTGIGKTRATAALARALGEREAARGSSTGVTIVKLAQTGLRAEECGDADEAVALARGVACDGNDAAGDAARAEGRYASRELCRFALPADPWAAALAERREPPRAAALAHAALAFQGGGAAARHLVIEGSGGVAEYLARRGMAVACIALAEPWAAVDDDYRRQVERALTAKTPVHRALARAVRPASDIEPLVVRLRFEPDAHRSVDRHSFATLVP